MCMPGRLPMTVDSGRRRALVEALYPETRKCAVWARESFACTVPHCVHAQCCRCCVGRPGSIAKCLHRVSAWGAGPAGARQSGTLLLASNAGACVPWACVLCTQGACCAENRCPKCQGVMH